MSAKTKVWIFAITAILITVSMLLLSTPNHIVSAQSIDTTSNSCLTCHEDLYYLHDSGKYYCITEHKDRCVNCHDGNSNEMDKDQAHFGLTAHPQENNGAKCQECHTEDTQTRLATFASLSGGFKSVIEPVTYTPKVEEKSSFPTTPDENQPSRNWIWLVSGTAFFGLWLALVLLSPQKP